MGFTMLLVGLMVMVIVMVGIVTVPDCHCSCDS